MDLHVRIALQEMDREKRRLISGGIFLATGGILMLLALIGSVLGIILSNLIVILQEKFHIISLPENIYFVSYLPMTFSIKESFYILGVSIVSSVIFSSFALSQILSINPSRILKN